MTEPKLTRAAHGNEYPAMVVEAIGSVLVVNSGAPTVVVAVKSVRPSLARRTAPSILSWPAPCSNMLELGNCCAVYIRIILTMFGVSFGLACNIKAAAPATTGVAIDVPLRYIAWMFSPLLIAVFKFGYLLTRELSSDSAAIILLPGATRSGFIRLS